MQQLEQILQNSLQEINSINDIQTLEQLKTRYIGRQGHITVSMQKLKNLEPDERKNFGQLINNIKNEFIEAWEARHQKLLQLKLDTSLINEAIDITLPGWNDHLGSLHPVSIVLNQLIGIFDQLGFSAIDGPEIESDYYNFTALNIPQSHPARAMQDTFYTEHNNVLRTHTSPMQVRYAEQNQPPIKIIAPGRVYRVDMDATHSPMFHQMELLWIEEGINFANLKAIVIEFMRNFFEDENLQIRFRASFFPFTEPSAEIDIYYSKFDRWLEVGGCGMVHPKVLQNMNIDSEKYTGFAFGFGIDRLAMLKFTIMDLRMLFENDLDFLQQFEGV